jgi:hypothetical protein
MAESIERTVVYRLTGLLAGAPEGAPQGLGGNFHRAIDIHECEALDESAFKALVGQAVVLNSAVKAKRPEKTKA